MLQRSSNDFSRTILTSDDCSTRVLHYTLGESGGSMKRYAALLLFFSSIATAQKPLEVVAAGPTGPLDTIERAAEIRVTFSEPMVAMQQVAPASTVPFFRIEPAVQGTFRWIGTNTLVFVPKEKLPYSATYRVTIAATAAARSGARLAEAYIFSFTTPFVRLTHNRWYRSEASEGAPVVIGLWFNQPVDRAAILPRVRLRYSPHTPEIPPLSDAADPASRKAYERKKTVAQNTAALDKPLLAFFAKDWNREVIGDSPSLVVLQTQPGVPYGSRIVIEIEGSGSDESIDGPNANLIQLDPFFFVRDFTCAAACDPSGYNAIRFTTPVLRADLLKAIRVEDVSDAAKPALVQPRKVDMDGDYPSQEIAFDSLGYSLRPARTYRVHLDPSLRAADRQTLGYGWSGTFDLWHQSGFASFGEGNGVWESSGGTTLPFYARNLASVDQQVEVLTEDTLFPAILRTEKNERPAAGVAKSTRKLRGPLDEIVSHGLDVSKAIGADSQGLIRVTLSNELPVPRARRDREESRSSVIQFTNLGITLKYSPVNFLVFVTRLDDGAPVPGATVRLRTSDNKVRFEGTTDEDGLFMAGSGELLKFENSWDLNFLVTAAKSGDFAYVGSNWTEGIRPWEFGIYGESESDPTTLRASVFTDRGIYRPGEEVRIKSIVRLDSAEGMKLAPAGTAVTLAVNDGRGTRVAERTVKLNAWSSAETSFKLDDAATLGEYTITLQMDGRDEALNPASFTVGAYRRPQFRVDTVLAAVPPVAGTELRGSVSARYLSGAAMTGRKAILTFSRQATRQIPRPIHDRYPEERFAFGGFPADESIRANESRVIATEERTIDAQGSAAASIPSSLEGDDQEGVAHLYEMEATVVDVSRQRIANRSAIVMHPASIYLGISGLPYFTGETKITPQIVAVDLEGNPVAGVSVTAELTQFQWNSVRRAEGGSFYTWESERKSIPAGTKVLTTATTPRPLEIEVKSGGEYELKLTARDGNGRVTNTWTTFYVSSSGYSAWQRYDHNRIDIEPERKKYRPGEIARILIRSPWERATALVTTEREGIRTRRQFELDSTIETIEIPITEEYVPNVFVSVLLVKGRSAPATDGDPADPGRPAFRLGYTALQIEDSSRRLDVRVNADKAEYRPGGNATVRVRTTDPSGRGVRSEVTLWAVDYGVLSLTGYREPNVLSDIYVEKPLLVTTADSRQKIISRRATTPKGASEGGGGGRDLGAGALRKDFRPLAFWLGSIETGANGELTTKVTLPESLTTYRIMAVASDAMSRFGSGATEIRTDKPVQLRPAFPRFLTKGDTARFGSVVANQRNQRTRALVTMQSLDPSIIRIDGQASQTIDIDAQGTREVPFAFTALNAGTARLRMSVQAGNETDAFEERISVRLFATPETVAAAGRTDAEAVETLRVPQNVVPGIGGFDVEIASTSLVGLSEGSRYLVTYPYGCAEQRASALLGVILPAQLGVAYPLDVDVNELRRIAQNTINELGRFSTSDGGFSYWPRASSGDPYVTAWLTNVLQIAKRFGYSVPDEMLQGAHGYMNNWLTQRQEPLASLSAWELARRAFVVKVLAEANALDASQLTRLAGAAPRMPVFANAFLLDAMAASSFDPETRQQLERRIRSSIAPEATTAHVDEWNDVELEWLWSSNTRSTAIVLDSLVRHTSDDTLVHRMVRWLMQRRVNGRWSNTQENAWAMLALAGYAAKFEKETPAFSATVRTGATALLEHRFEGRTTEAVKRTLSLSELGELAGTGELAIRYLKEGTGTLHYVSRLRYAIDPSSIEALDRGFRVERTSKPLQGAASRVRAGDLIQRTLTVTTTKGRSFVALSDPIPAGFEIVDSALRTTASADLATSEQDSPAFDHVERRDDRVDIFATTMPAGTHRFTYTVRAITTGTFRTPPATALQMYEPEVFGRTSSSVVEIEH